MRTQGGAADPYSSGTYVAADGAARHLRLSDYSVEVLEHWKSPATGANYPSKWRVRIPSIGWDITVEPTVAVQEMRTQTMGVTYWEGRVRACGTANGQPISGQGYVELTGYAEAFRQAF
jgi:predicted secreted hydrolase